MMRDANKVVYKKCSSRELEVFEKIISGLTNKVISEELFISERTVKFHCKNIYQKLNVKNRLSLIIKYKDYSPYAVNKKYTHDVN